MSKSAYSFRWGIKALDDEGGLYLHGFMLRNYSKAGVTRDEFLCIVHLAAYHYESKRGQSSPSLATIATVMGYGHVNSVWRLVHSLRKKKMLEIAKNPGRPSIYNAHGFAQAMLDLDTLTLEGDSGITLEGDTPSHPNVDEEEEENKKKKIGANAPTPDEIEHYESVKAEHRRRGLEATAAFASNQLSLTDAIRQYCGFAVSRNKTNDGMLQTLREMKATPADIEKFSRWWKQDWRGEDGSPPTLKSILEFWPSAQAWNGIHRNGSRNGRRPRSQGQPFDRAKYDAAIAKERAWVIEMRNEGKGVEEIVQITELAEIRVRSYLTDSGEAQP